MVAGLAPPDALRAAQLWMLDPERSPVPGLSGDLLALAERSRDLFGTVPAWAGFIHQGNPRSAGRARARRHRFRQAGSAPAQARQAGRRRRSGRPGALRDRARPGSPSWGSAPISTDHSSQKLLAAAPC
ncbi:hypothetical protein Sm713_71820 [Streptomyces sp. TS71-3]|nr:hypothetical protein Sm713_71820 [Streptomyces sp. TS71-3]